MAVTDAENGISAKTSVEFTVDTRPPEVAVALPAELYSTSASPVRIEGTAVDECSNDAPRLRDSVRAAAELCLCIRTALGPEDHLLSASRGRRPRATRPRDHRR